MKKNKNQTKSSLNPGSASQSSTRMPLAAVLLSFWTCWILFDVYRKGRTLHALEWGNFEDLLLYFPRVIAGGLGRNILLVAAMWFIFTEIGNVLFRSLGLRGATKIERLLLSAGFGAGTASLALFGMGLAGFWQPGLLRACFYGGGAICAGAAVSRARRPRPENSSDAALPATPDRPHFWMIAAAVLMSCAVLMNLLATAGPEISYDALVYHLALPKLYLLNGRIVPTPQNLYSGMPQGMEMLYGVALALGNEHLAALIHCSFGWAATLGLWAWLRRYGSKEAGMLGALIFSLCPVVLYSGGRCGVDLGGAFYSVLALTTISSALQAQDDRQSLAWAAAMGIVLGFFLGVKYTVLPLSGAFLLVHFWLRRRAGGNLRETLLAAGAAAVLFAPWLLKNVHFYGNPVYPFLRNMFGAASPVDWKAFLSDARSRDLARTLGTAAGWKELLLCGWQISIGAGIIDDRIGAVCLILIPAAFFLRWGISRQDSSVPPAWTAAAMLALIGYFSWCATSSLVRFIIPVLPLIICVSVLAAEKRTASASWLRHVVWFAALWMCLIDFEAVFRGGEKEILGTWNVLRGRQSQADYLENARVSYGVPYYAAMEYVNRNLPPDAKVLFLGEPRAYYCERNFLAATVFDGNPFWALAREAKDADALRAGLKSLGITHIFLNAFQMYWYSNFERVMPGDAIGRPVFAEFWARYLRKVYEKKDNDERGQLKDWLAVYELRDVPSDDPNGAPQNVPGFILEQSRLAR